MIFFIDTVVMSNKPLKLPYVYIWLKPTTKNENYKKIQNPEKLNKNYKNENTKKVAALLDTGSSISLVSNNAEIFRDNDVQILHDNTKLVGFTNNTTTADGAIQACISDEEGRLRLQQGKGESRLQDVEEGRRAAEEGDAKFY